MSTQPTDAVALARYKVVPAHESMFHRFAVVAGDGKQQLYLGREVECENMARKFAGAFLDGAFYQANITPSTQAAGSVPAVEREQERIAFKDAHRHLDLDEVPDAWGRPMFKHSHVEASWLGWIARASHGQAPAETGNSVSAQTDSVLYDPNAVLDVFHSARAGSEKPVGYLRGILAVIAHWESRPEPHRWMVPARADSALEDAARYRHLRDCNSGSLVVVQITGTGEDDWYVLTEDDADAAIDTARKQGENHDR